MARLPFDGVLRLCPEDVLRLAMLLALLDGDLDAAAEHAKRLQPKWGDEMCSVAQANPRRAEVMCINMVAHRMAIERAAESDHPHPVWHGLGEISDMAAAMAEAEA